MLGHRVAFQPGWSASLTETGSLEEPSSQKATIQLSHPLELAQISVALLRTWRIK